MSMIKGLQICKKSKLGVKKITLSFVNRLDFDIFTLANPSTEGLCSGTDYIQVLVFVISISLDVMLATETELHKITIHEK